MITNTALISNIHSDLYRRVEDIKTNIKYIWRATLDADEQELVDLREDEPNYIFVRSDDEFYEEHLKDAFYALSYIANTTTEVSRVNNMYPTILKY